jgi:hypothetical protein
MVFRHQPEVACCPLYFLLHSVTCISPSRPRPFSHAAKRSLI